MKTRKLNEKQFKTRSISNDSLNCLSDDNKTQGDDVVRETQSDIDNFFRETVKRNPNGFGGKGWVWE